MNSFEERINLNVPLDDICKEICKAYRLSEKFSYELIEIGYEDFNFKLRTEFGRFVCKIFSTFRSDEEAFYLAERALKAYESGALCPRIFLTDDKALFVTEINGVKYRIMLMEEIVGENFYNLKALPTENELKIIAKSIAKLNKLDYRPPFIYDHWAIINFEKEFNENVNLLKEGERILVNEVYQNFKNIDLKKLKYGFVHGDIIETNLIRAQNGDLYFIDFSVSNYQPRIVDLAIFICDMCLDLNNLKKSQERIKHFLHAYEKESPLTAYEKYSLNIFLAAHQAITILETTKEKHNGNNSEENEKFFAKGKQGLSIVLKHNFI